LTFGTLKCKLIKNQLKAKNTFKVAFQLNIYYKSQQLNLNNQLFNQVSASFFRSSKAEAQANMTLLLLLTDEGVREAVVQLMVL
jgi:5-hydroxyisourate hydrolase-like protein (transthyretin family)